MGKGASKLPEAGDIPACLDTPLVQQLPLDVKAKVIQQFNEYKSQYDELESSHERLRVDSEQRYFDLEKNFMTSNEKLVSNLEIETKSAKENRQLVETLEQKLKESSALVEEFQKKKNEAESTTRDLESTRCNVEVEKADLAQALDRKTHEIDRLNVEWKEMSDKLAKANKERLDALAQKEQVDTQIVSIQHREQRLQQENGLLIQQNEWLDQELKSKVNELLNFRRDQSGRLLECEAQVEQHVEEARHLEAMVESLKETNDEQAQKIETYCDKLKELRDMQSQREEQHGSQVHAQHKLIELYKTSAGELEVQVKELTSAVTELQKLLKLASEAHAQVEKDKQETISEHMDTIKARDEEIERMDKELQNANELLEVARKKGNIALTDEAIEALSPSAAAASRLLKSGMTLTQIYSEYVNASEQLLVERQENERLQQYLDRILEEIEEKAPLMKKQREDYEKSITVIDQLTRQLDTARLEEEKLRVDSDDGRRKVLHFTRENQRFKQQTTDLGQQVRMLLKELEEARGTVVSSDITMETDISVAEVSSSSHIISTKLVTFRGIEEMQKKNQELIAALRSLSDEREDAEKMAMDTRTADLKQQVDTLSEQVTIMREARDRQVTMVEALVRQRDMYRVLLSESGSMPLPATPTPQTSTPMQARPVTPAEKPALQSLNESQVQLTEKTAALKELMEEFNQYREEKNKSQTMLTEQIENFRKDKSDQRVQNAKLASQLDFSGERMKILQNNAESYKKEISALRDKNQNYSASVIRHEQTINSLKEDLFGVKERLSRAEVVADNLRVERNMLKSVEARLVQEKETSLREQSGQRMLLTNLQAIQNNLERSDFENKTRLKQQIEMLEKENAGLKSKLDGIDGQHRSIIATLDRQLVDVQNESERRLKSGSAMRAQLEESQHKTQGLIDEVAAIRSELDKAKAEVAKHPPGQEKPELPKQQQEQQIQQSTRSMIEDEVKHFRNQLDAARAELKSMKGQLDQARQHTEQYKMMASSMELTLKEQTETTRHFKETTETQLKDTREGNERIEKQLIQVEKERQNLTNENFRLTENYHKTNAELQKQLQILQCELEEAMTLRETAISNELTARSDHSNQAVRAQQAQDNYERELMLHAADVAALTNVKQQLESFTTRLTAAEDQARDASIALTTAKSGWVDQEKLYKAEEAKLKSRITTMQDQNRLLHEEMDAMSEQVMMIQHRREQEHQETATMALEVASDSTTERSTDQLFEVIRFLRKEKEIAEARFEVTEAESNRVKQRTEHLERQLEETNRALTEERQNAQVNLATAAQHMELLRKVDNLNLVTESNKLLRGERDQLSVQLREAEGKAKKLENDITPLQSSQHEVAAERDALSAEKVALTAEVERWRARTNHLIEQCNKTDPEEHKRLLQERETLRKQVATITEETHKLRADISRLNANVAKLDGELISQKQECETMRVSQVKLTTQLAEKTKECEDKFSNIIQLRKVGRKYKTEVQQLTTEVKKLNDEIEKGTGGAITILEEKLKKAEADLATVTEKLGSSDFEKNEATKAGKEVENRCKALQETFDKATEELKTATENNAKLAVINKTLQEQINKLTEDLKKLKDTESKQQHLRNTIASAKTKILGQKEQVEKLGTEILELKRKNAELTQSAGEANAKKAAYESRIGTLERDLGQLKSALTAAQTENQQIAQLQQKITVLQKQLETQQKPQQATTPKPTVSASPVAGHRHTGPKANIPPMATVTIQPFPVQPVRRITVAPTPPTATVMPTSQSAPEGEMASPSSQVRPTPPVQTVSPHIETESQELTEPAETETPEAPQEPTPSTSTGRETAPAPQHGSGKRTRDGADSSDTEQEGPVKRPKTQTAPIGSGTPAVQIQEVETTAIPQEGAAQESAEVAIEPQPQQQVQLPQQEDSVQPKEVGVVEPASQTAPQQETAPTTSAPPPQSAPEPRVAETRPTGAVAQQDTVIVLDDDDEEEEEGEFRAVGAYGIEQGTFEEGDEENAEYDGADVEDEEGAEHEQDDEFDEEDQEPEEYEDEEDVDEMEDDEDDYNSGEMEMDEEDDEEEEVEEDESAPQEIVIVDDDDEESNEPPMASQEQQPPSTDQPVGTQETSHVPPRLRVPRMQPRAEPSTSAARAQQLQPFLLATQVSQFDDGDDSIVPSTPTLVIPKGTDQVAISSPQVPQGRFLFGSGLQSEPAGIAQSSLADLASQGGVDDTRMDLSQFDDNATGRSMPTTPQSRTPPAISITEASTQEDEVVEAGARDAAIGQSATVIPSTEKPIQVEGEKDGETLPDMPEGGAADESRLEGQSEATPSTSHEGVIEDDQAETGPIDKGDATSQEDKSGPTSDQQDRPEPAAVKQKKIQRIVWDQPASQRAKRGARGGRGMASTQRGAPHPGQQPGQHPSPHGTHPVPTMGGPPGPGFQQQQHGAHPVQLIAASQVPGFQQQQQQQPQGMVPRGGMQRGRGRVARGNKSRRSRPF